MFSKFSAFFVYVHCINSCSFLFLYSIDGTGQRKLIIYANDSREKDANCVARLVCTDSDLSGPFIVTKRDVEKGEELTYSYGNYPYEWRVKNDATGTENSTEAEKSEHVPGMKDGIS